jgi:excisionase family DNA binding protein
MTMSELVSDPLLVDVMEAARLLDCGRTMVYALISAGDLESVKVGGSRKVPRAAIDDYVARLRDAR